MMSATLLDLRAFEATKYMSGVALTVSLFDHLLNFGDELELVWSQPRSWSILQSIVMVNRYGGELSMIFIAYILAGFRPPISTSTCHGFVVVVCTYGIFGSALSQFVLLLRIVGIWDNRKSVKYALVGGFIVCLGTSLAFAILTTLRSFGWLLRIALHAGALMKDIGAMSYSAPLNICVINPAAYHGLIVEYTQGVWGGMLLYDVYVFAILIANAMNRPRRHNAEIITNLNRDGAFIFLAFFALRLAQLLPSVSGNAAFMFLTPAVAWALDNTLSSRLFLKMKAIEIRKRPGWSPMEDLPSVYVMQTIELDDS